MNGPTDELWERTRCIAAERLRPERLRPERRRSDDPLRELIATLAGLLANPGPPDAHRPQPVQTPVEDGASAVNRTDTEERRAQDQPA